MTFWLPQAEAALAQVEAGCTPAGTVAQERLNFLYARATGPQGKGLPNGPQQAKADVAVAIAKAR